MNTEWISFLALNCAYAQGRINMKTVDIEIDCGEQSLDEEPLVVLLVDDYSDFLTTTKVLLRAQRTSQGRNKYDVRVASTPLGAFKLVHDLECPAVLLLDQHLGPVTKGNDLHAYLQARARYPLPVCFVSGDDSLESKKAALSLRGVFGYLTKGRDTELLVTHVEMGRREIEDKLAERIDHLTGLLDKKGGVAALKIEISRAKRKKTPIACIFLDVDNFKRVNDTYGHLVGDEVLHAIATHILRNKRPQDTAVRFGGDEMTIILADTNEEEAKAVIRRITEDVKNCVFKDENGGEFSVTVSLGLAMLLPEEIIDEQETFKALMRLADKKMYAAKEDFKNSVK